KKTRLEVMADKLAAKQKSQTLANEEAEDLQRLRAEQQVLEKELERIYERFPAFRNAPTRPITAPMRKPGTTEEIRAVTVPNFVIPIIASDEQRAKTDAFLLYWSHDQGKTWTISPLSSSKRSVDFTAGEDGEYWFSIITSAKTGDAALQ